MKKLKSPWIAMFCWIIPIVFAPSASSAAPCAEFVASRGYQASINRYQEVLPGRAISENESFYLRWMSTLVSCSGGEMEDGIFVTRPGVELLSQPQLSSQARSAMASSPRLKREILKSSSVTFLIAGISVETSMELIAHGEASVARLTSSSTQAMNLPFYRIQGKSKSQQKELLGRLIQVRNDYDLKAHPMKEWENGKEFFNIFNSASKVTALTYTMTLADFHKLFLGRLSPKGNEIEVQEVVRKMCTDLHALFPDIILSPDVYIGLGNGEKYKAELSVATPSVSASQMAETISDLGGSVDKNLILKPGILLSSETLLTEPATILFKAVNIDQSQSPADQLLEFRSRITYLTFLKEPASSTEYIRKMVKELQHLSVADATRVGVLVIGLPYLNALELKSRVLSLNGGAFILDHFAEVGGDSSSSLLKLSPDQILPLTPETQKIFFQSHRATEFGLSLSLKGFHKLFREAALLTEKDREIRDLFRLICQDLHLKYPSVIESPTDYGV